MREGGAAFTLLSLRKRGGRRCHTSCSERDAKRKKEREKEGLFTSRRGKKGKRGKGSFCEDAQEKKKG